MFNFKRKKFLDFAGLMRTADSLAGKIPARKTRRRLIRARKFLKYFSWLVLALLAIFLVLFSVSFLNLKTIYGQALAGKNNLEQAITLIGQDKFSQAMGASQAAENNFNLAAAALDEMKQAALLNRRPAVLSQFNEIESLLVAGQFLSRAVYRAADFGASLEAVVGGDKRLSFSKFSVTEKRRILQKIFESAPELNGIKADLDLVLLNLEQVEARGLLLILKGKIVEASEKISKVSQLLEKAVPMSQLIPALAGYPEETKFLVLLENSDELRPTGGFLGTYGILRIKDGEITDFITHDVYHLDMPVQDKMAVAPPEPIKKYLNDKWYFRDANWSPDWPTAARKINWFFELESRLNPAAEKISDFDGLIALTPKLITDLLGITGPLTIEGQIYNQNNFTELLEYRVEKGYQVLGVPKWQRKEVIGLIAKELKIKIFDLPAASWAAAAKVLAANLDEKNLLFYFSDNQLEKLAVKSGWGGEIKNHDGDYLYAVDANLAALKTDAVMSRGLNYQVSQGADGLFARLTLSYSHNGQVDWKTSAYKSYTRVYVPSGSQLIKISGYRPEQIGSGAEAGKTWFGFHLTVAPGEITNLTIDYKLPASVVNHGNYSLFLQKQPGKETGQAAVDLSFLNEIKSYSPASLSVRRRGLNELEWGGKLDRDKSFEINF